MQLGITKDSKDLAAKIQAINEQILRVIARDDQIRNEQDMGKLEQETQTLTRELGDLIVAQKVQRTINEDEAFRASALDLSHRVRKSMVNIGASSRSCQIFRRYATPVERCLLV